MARRNRTMNKLLRLAIDIQFLNDPTRPGLKVFVKPEAVRDLCLGLSLLHEALVDALIVAEVGSKKSVKFRVKAGGADDPRGQMSVKQETAIVDLHSTGLKYLLYFFLRYYRDGI